MSNEELRNILNGYKLSEITRNEIEKFLAARKSYLDCLANASAGYKDGRGIAYRDLKVAYSSLSSALKSECAAHKISPSELNFLLEKIKEE